LEKIAGSIDRKEDKERRYTGSEKDEKTDILIIKQAMRHIALKSPFVLLLNSL
jgi:hypothetical protein